MAELNIRARNSVYTDLDFAFRPIQMESDLPGDIALKKDVEAVKQSVLNILKTNRGEKPFLPSFGSNIKSYLFENIDESTRILIEEDIVFSLRNFEPRVNIIFVNVENLEDNNEVKISIELEIITPIQVTATVEFALERLR